MKPESIACMVARFEKAHAVIRDLSCLLVDEEGCPTLSPKIVVSATGNIRILIGRVTVWDDDDEDAETELSIKACKRRYLQAVDEMRGAFVEVGA